MVELTSAERQRLKLERENRELRRSKHYPFARASAYFARKVRPLEEVMPLLDKLRKLYGRSDRYAVVHIARQQYHCQQQRHRINAVPVRNAMTG